MCKKILYKLALDMEKIQQYNNTAMIRTLQCICCQTNLMVYNTFATCYKLQLCIDIISLVCRSAEFKGP